MSILHNGDIFVCPNVERRPELIQGNVRTHDLAQQWQNGFAFFRERNRTLSERCRSCYERDNCLGDSLHTWDFDTHTPRFCIRDFYNAQQNAAYSAQQQLYDEVVDAYRERCALSGQPNAAAVLRVYSNRPAACRVLLTAEAADALYTFFAWGQDTPVNRQEQMACLLGRQAEGLLVVEAVQEVSLLFADAQSAVFSQVTLDSAAVALEQYQLSQPTAVLLGFVHSHPNELKKWQPQSRRL